MSPDELETHNKVRSAVGYGVAIVNDEAEAGEYFADGALLTNTRANLATVPDGMFVRWATSEAGRVRFVPRKDRHGQFIEIRGTPDWVLEVVSLSSVHKDTIDLPILYHRAGIHEFWLIDARGEEIDFRILLRGRTKYVSATLRAGWLYSPVFKRSRVFRSRRNK